MSQNTINSVNGHTDVIELDHAKFANIAAVQAATKQIGSNTLVSRPNGGLTQGIDYHALVIINNLRP